MRLNQYIARSSDLSRRSADQAISEGRVTVNGQPAQMGQSVEEADNVTLDGRLITPTVEVTTIILNKPVGYVCSRAGQGSKTIYDLLPEELHHLKSVGRLDKDSSGLLLLTNDGQLANRLTHPRYQKTKVYEIRLDKELTEVDYAKITRLGVKLGDGLSTFQLDYVHDKNMEWLATMKEGRNRQIRRTFAALGYRITHLHRTTFGNYTLGHLAPSKYQLV